jgi:hypothetical protein
MKTNGGSRRHPLTSTIISELLSIGTIADPYVDFPIEDLGVVAQVLRAMLGEIEAEIATRRETWGGRA